MEKLTFGIWWMDGMLAIGSVFLAALALGFPAWAVVDEIRHRRSDAQDLAARTPAKTEAVSK